MGELASQKRVLVTGATGFIGSHTIRPLLQRGYEVHAVSSKSAPTSDTPVIWHQADLFDNACSARLLEDVQPTHLLHLAWYVVPGKLISSELNFDWVRSSMELLKSFQRKGGRRIVMPGSSYEYDWSYGYCHETRTPTIPNTTYGACKHALDLMTQALCRTHGLSYAWPRVFFLYGPNTPRSARVVRDSLGVARPRSPLFAWKADSGLSACAGCCGCHCGSTR